MIKFVSKLNSDSVMQLNKHTVKKSWWLFLLVSLIFVILGALNLVGEEPDIVFGILAIAFGVIFTPMCLLFTSVVVKRQSQSMPSLSDETVQTFVFDNQQVTITAQKGEDFHSETVAKYNYFYRIEESATHFFLYISKNQSHILPKSDLVEGSLDDLKTIFAKNMGANYKIRKK